MDSLTKAFGGQKPIGTPTSGIIDPTVFALVDLNSPPQRPELDKIEAAVKSGENVDPQDVLTLLKSSMEKDSYAVQQLGYAIGKLNQNGNYDAILSEAMEFAIANEDTSSLSTLHSCAKPSQAVSQKALAFAEELGLTSEYDSVSLEDRSVVGELRRATNPEAVATLRRENVERYQQERAAKQAKLAAMSPDEFKEECEKIFNPEGYVTDDRLNVVAALGGGRMAERTNIQVTKNDGSFEIRLSQEGLFPQACHEAVIDLERWEYADVNTSGSSGGQQYATITIPHDKLLDFTSSYFVRSRGGSSNIPGMVTYRM